MVEKGPGPEPTPDPQEPIPEPDEVASPMRQIARMRQDPEIYALEEQMKLPPEQLPKLPGGGRLRQQLQGIHEREQRASETPEEEPQQPQEPDEEQ